jgi:hypothetical protein
MLQIQLLQLTEPNACDLVVTNQGASTLWNVSIPIQDMSCDIFFLDDTHMPDHAKLPPVQLLRIGAGETLRVRQAWGGLRGSRNLTGSCLIQFSCDELGNLRQLQTASFIVDPQADQSG